MEISFSKFRIWRECPWKYKLQFVDGRKPPLDPAASLGLSLHRALERYHADGEPRWESLAEAYDVRFLHGGYPDAETKAKWSRKGLRILEKYYESEIQRRSEVVGVEKEFVFSLGRHRVRGMVDRVDRLPDGRYELIDYKTRFGLGPGEELPPPDGDLQLRFYALGARQALGLTPSVLTIHYLAAGKTVSCDYDGAGEEALQAEIVRVADAIEQAAYQPDQTFCPKCVFKTQCQHAKA